MNFNESKILWTIKKSMVQPKLYISRSLLVLEEEVYWYIKSEKLWNRLIMESIIEEVSNIQSVIWPGAGTEFLSW